MKVMTKKILVLLVPVIAVGAICYVIGFERGLKFAEESLANKTGLTPDQWKKIKEQYDKKINFKRGNKNGL